VGAVEKGQNWEGYYKVRVGRNHICRLWSGTTCSGKGGTSWSGLSK